SPTPLPYTTLFRSRMSHTLDNPSVTVNFLAEKMRGLQNIKGEHLIRPDGTISLGMYGSVHVAGMTLGQVKCAVEIYLSQYLVDPQISVDVVGYNSRKIHIVQAAHSEESRPAAKAQPDARMTIDDVVRMSQKGISSNIIIRQ